MKMTKQEYDEICKSLVLIIAEAEDNVGDAQHELNTAITNLEEFEQEYAEKEAKL